MVKFTSIKFIFLMLIVQSSAYASHENHQSTPEQQNEDKGTNDQTYNLDFQYHVLRAMLSESDYAKTIAENPNAVLVHPKEIAKQRFDEQLRAQKGLLKRLLTPATAVCLAVLIRALTTGNPCLLSRLIGEERFQLLKDATDVTLTLFYLACLPVIVFHIKNVLFDSFESRARATTNLTLIVDNLIHLKRFIPKRYHTLFQQLHNFRACSDRHKKLFQQQAPQIVDFLLYDIESVLLGEKAAEQEEYAIKAQLNKIICNSEAAKNQNFSEIFSQLQTTES